ncbi:hypothetical protein DLM86_27435 [Paenibacillus flagellatus]|uniref:Uncharacterized protein n=1 Tax=Paenibacillus flagellatus TaxID=2211139 RepID=A0A2V5KQA6_9BACL|nr:hypothetical protein DLM86_27435 [Paenibacillus flagellatus]
MYGLQGKRPNVDFDGKIVYFIGVYESGSCPYTLKKVELSSDRKTLTVPLSEPKGACTTDATPRTFVIGLDKETANEIENVVMVRSGVETKLPLNP